MKELGFYLSIPWNLLGNILQGNYSLMDAPIMMRIRINIIRSHSHFTAEKGLS